MNSQKRNEQIASIQAKLITHMQSNWNEARRVSNRIEEMFDEGFATVDPAELERASKRMIELSSEFDMLLCELRSTGLNVYTILRKIAKS